ncbi:hypothetical protein B7494_g284 [Chlorociboria aeruginascens]|nr:hypothetical protein B7494_g284 [Chlorociboria aeruginascens]
MPAGLATTRSGPGAIGVAISRPTQMPQWPLSGTIENAEGENRSYQPPPGRGPPPQRPPRPSHVPSMLDASRLQEHTPSFQYTSHNPEDSPRGRPTQEDDDSSPTINNYSPITPSSRPSTTSSVGTIPDFPLPMPGQPRRSANLGPPPSSRRGASSYYSQASYVSPIPEESPRTLQSHHSIASSAAIPSNWGSESPGYYDDEDEGRLQDDVIEEGRESRESTVDDNDDRGLIRSASLGKRAKPSVVTTKSTDKVEQRPTASPIQKGKLKRTEGINGMPRPEGMGPPPRIWPMIGSADSPLASGTGFIDSSPSTSDNSTPTVARALSTNEPVRAHSTNSPEAQAAKANMLGAYQAASSLGESKSSRLSAIRRPPRLDIDAVRDAEARGSLTSLPDLIRRATRLAAMMDRGKRPASRGNDLNDFDTTQLANEKEIGERRQSGLSGMLAAFPPPGLSTPSPRPNSPWPSVFNPSPANLDAKQERKPRRCCGMPCWLASLVLLILLVVIAAAVVVPLELLVIHKHKSTAPVAQSEASSCATDNTTACQNGGTSITTNSTCSCICINGFSGNTCTDSSAMGCTTANLSTTDPTYFNVTLGSSIPRLIAASETNFSVQLFGSEILARFNSANLSCAAENALVTFDGNSDRVGASNEVVSTTISASASIASATGTSGVVARDTATEGGLLVDTSATSLLTSSASSPTTTSPASATPTINPFADFSVTEAVLDFARVVVLFVLQQSDLDAAVAAQGALQSFFDLTGTKNQAAMNVSLGNGFFVDLVDEGWNSSVTTKRRRATGPEGRSFNLWDEN